MTNAWTQGPWTIFKPMKGKYRGDFAIAPSAGPAFAYLAQGRDDIQEANARLIVAAPDMVGALDEAERIVAYFAGEYEGAFIGGGTPATCLVTIRAALAKARGEAP